MSEAQRERFTAAAEAALRVRRHILLLAAHASGHHQQLHGDWCESCKEEWPCPGVRRAAGPALDAVADLPSQRNAAQPTVDEIDLYSAIEAITVANDVDGGRQLAQAITDAVVALPFTDAGQVRATARREVAEEIAAAIEARIHDSANYGWASNRADGLEHAARIARAHAEEKP